MFDIQHHNIAPTEPYSLETKRQEIEKIVFADKVVLNGKVVTDWTDGEKISDNLWKVKRLMPSEKQIKNMESRKYKKPLLLNNWL